MFFDTADCIVVKGTTVEPGIGGGAAEEAVDFGGGGGADSTFDLISILLEGVIPAAASISAGVIRPKGPVPTTDSILTLCCFASFFADGVATVFLGESETGLDRGGGGGGGCCG